MAIALVTSGSHSIRQATALLLAKEEYTVAVNYQQNLHAAQEVVNLITQASGKAFMLQADISNKNQVITMFTAINQHNEPLAALVNNTRILFTQCTIENLTTEQINQVLSTNMTGYFLCCHEAVKHMALKNGGSGSAIINVSSVASQLGSPGEYVDYTASKGAIDTLTTRLSLEVTTQGIHVNYMQPGFIYTKMHTSSSKPGHINHVKSNIPMQHGGQAEEVTQAIVWLLSDKASYITGSFINLAGRK